MLPPEPVLSTKNEFSFPKIVNARARGDTIRGAITGNSAGRGLKHYLVVHIAAQA
jgi:hypothetical protein